METPKSWQEELIKEIKQLYIDYSTSPNIEFYLHLRLTSFIETLLKEKEEATIREILELQVHTGDICISEIKKFAKSRGIDL